MAFDSRSNGGAIAQISAQSNAVLRIAPPGMQPPNIIQFNASNVPVVQVTINSRTLDSTETPVAGVEARKSVGTGSVNAFQVDFIKATVPLTSARATFV